MPTLTQLIATVDTTYRNTYSTAQKVEWMDTIQKQIFQTVRHEALPWYFTTVSGSAYYPLPDDCDPMGIKRVTIETKANSEKYDDLRFISSESNEAIGLTEQFYSIEAGENIYINPIPTDDDQDRKVYIYYNKRPADLSASQMDTVPDLEEDFQELLVLGCLERIARARGEYDDKNVFANDFAVLLRDYKSLYRTPYPEYTKPKDVMPRRRGQVNIKTGRRLDVYPWGD